MIKDDSFDNGKDIPNDLEGFPTVNEIYEFSIADFQVSSNHYHERYLTYMIKCQSCLDRQVEEPNEAIGLWQGLPICDSCLGPLLDNISNVPLDTNVSGNGNSLESRKELAVKLLDAIESISQSWPLTAEETLTCHEDFYNHRPPALVNCSLTQIQEIYSRRKGILFAVRHKDERWATDIENLKKSKREEANLTGIAAGKKESSKKVPSDAITKEKNKKIAASIGLSLEQYEATLLKAKELRYEQVVGAKKDTVETVPHIRTTATGEILKGLQTKVKDKQISESSPKGKTNPVTGRPYA